MPSDIAQVDIADHDRYLIYEMIGREVSFRSPAKGRSLGRKRKGTVEQVCRNIFDNAVELTLSGRLFQFDEPVAIVGRNSNISFVYGDINALEMTDDELLTETRLSAYKGETLRDVLSRTKPCIVKVITFALSGPVKRPRRTWRKSN